jgi:Tfp pilus assembly protein PilF
MTLSPQPTSSVEKLFVQGNAALAQGDLAAAEKCYLTALRSAPEVAELHANLAYVLEALGDVTQAETSYRRALACNPGIAQVHANLGTLLAGQKRLHEAERAYTTSIVLDPDAPSGWSNLGGLYAGMKRDVEAELCCRQALLRDADHAQAQVNLAYVLLRHGRWEEGWRYLDARDWYRALQSRLACPRWQGEPLVGRAVLIGFEAGHGDMIQFVRYAAVLKAQGATRVGLLCHPALKTLFASLEAVDEVIAFDEDLSATVWDCWTAPLSLPRYCQTIPTSVVASLPYLHAEPQRVRYWQAQLPSRGLRVGLVWRGNPRFENDADRSLASVEVLAPLWDVEGVHFFSLQKGAGQEQAEHPPPGMPLQNLGVGLGDFADTAALIVNLDLVISVDTAVAHLAGALNRPCWVLLPHYKTDWRWFEQRSDSPWYPGVVRLFRQKADGEWHGVVEDVRLALQNLVTNAPCLEQAGLRSVV